MYSLCNVYKIYIELAKVKLVIVHITVPSYFRRLFGGA